MSQVFISYSHQDNKWKDRLVKHLVVLEKQNLLEIWDDRKIQVGQEWKPEIEKAINQARVAILLISANFLTSKFILEEEIPPLLQRIRKKEELTLFPVILEDCAWQQVSWLGKIQVYPKEGQTLSSKTDDQIEKELSNIATSVVEIIKALPQEKNLSPPPFSFDFQIENEGFLRLDLEIKQEPSGIRGSLYKGNKKFQIRENLVFHPNEIIKNETSSFSLQELWRLFIQKKSKGPTITLTEEQLVLGQHLYAQTLGRLDEEDLKKLDDIEVELRILSPQIDFAALPWIFLANPYGAFLSRTGWSISLAPNRNFQACELPPSPRILVATSSSERKGEHFREHVQEFRQMLADANPAYNKKQHFRIVSTWDEFRYEMQDFQPHLWYFYGQGQGDFFSPQLLLGDERKPANEISVEELVRLFPQTSLPSIVYLNCDFEDQNGVWGSAFLLRNLLPVVVTNCPGVTREVKQMQALSFWNDVLIKGVTPHSAVSRTERSLLELSTDPLWMTPILHASYDRWTSYPPARGKSVKDPFWHFKLDRIKQYSVATMLTMEMLQNKKPRSQVFVWYGQEGQGVDLFHQRLTIELQEKIPDIYFYEVQPRWPEELENIDVSFSEIFCEAFNVSTLEEIPSHIYSKNRGVRNCQVLVYIRHQPVLSSEIINPKTMKLYFEWWNEVMTPQFQGNTFALLGISFIVENPDKFYNALQKHEYDKLMLSNTGFGILDSMGKLGLKDLFYFVQTHNIPIPRHRLTPMLQQILEKTKGHYEKTVEELKALVQRAWNTKNEEAPIKITEEEDFDY